MQKILSRLILVVAVGAAGVHGAPIQYTIGFSGDSPSPSLGFFDYDPTLPTNNFTNFTVDWNGFVFDLTSAANAPIISRILPAACLGGATGAQASFAILTTCAALGGPGASEWQPARILNWDTTV